MSALSIPAATATAGRALRRFQGAGPTASAIPTPQRLLKAAGHAHVRMAVDAEGSAAMPRPQIKIADAPLDVLAKRKRLDPDPERAAAMLRAGRRYEELRRKSGLLPIKAQDFTAVRSTAIGSGFCGTDAKAEAWDLYSAARSAMRADECRVVDAVVLEERSLHDVGSTLGRLPSGERNAAIGIAAYVLRDGLERLAIHFGFLEVETPAHDKIAEGCIVADVYPVLHDMPPEMAALLGRIDAREARGA